MDTMSVTDALRTAATAAQDHRETLHPADPQRVYLTKFAAELLELAADLEVPFEGPTPRRNG